MARLPGGFGLLLWAQQQRPSGALLWLCGGDAALLKSHWSGATELLQLEGDLVLQGLLSLGPNSAQIQIAE